MSTPSPTSTASTRAFHYQWQYVDAITGAWTDFAGATSADFKVPNFLLTQGLGVRVKVSYVDGKGYTEQLFSAPTVAAITLPGDLNTAPTLVVGTQFNGISEHDRAVGQTFDFFSPFASDLHRPADGGERADLQRRPDGRLAAVQRQSVLHLRSGDGRRRVQDDMLVGPDGVLGTADDVAATLDTPGQIGVRVTATDPGGLSVTDTFFIDVIPPNSPPLAVDDTYTTSENVGLTTLPSTGVLHNDIDPNADPFTAALVTGPTNGTLTFHADGTFVYIPNHNFVGTDTFTYQDTDSAGAVSNIATATINVVNAGKITVVPTAPATTNSVTESFTAGALPPAQAVSPSAGTPRPME